MIKEEFSTDEEEMRSLKTQLDSIMFKIDVDRMTIRSSNLIKKVLTQ